MTAAREANARAKTGLPLVRISHESGELIGLYADSKAVEQSWASASQIGPTATFRVEGYHKDEVGSRKVTYVIPVGLVRWFSVLEPEDSGPVLEDD